ALRLRDLPLDPLQTSGHLPAVRRGGVEPPEEANQLADVVPGVVMAGRLAIPARRTAAPVIDHRLARIVVQRVQGDVGVVLPEPLSPLQPPQPVACRFVGARRNVVPADILGVGVEGFVEGARNDLPREFSLRGKGTLLPKLVLQYP